MKSASMSEGKLSLAKERGILTFWGVRGSIPTPGKHTVTYGGNTSCVSIESAEHLIILDAGSGIRNLGIDIQSRDKSSIPACGHIFITHYHWDHIQGLPFFSPAFDPKQNFKICGQPADSLSLHKILEEQMHTPFFPVEMDNVFLAHIDFPSLIEGEVFKISEDISLIPFNAFHPNSAFGFLVTFKGTRIAYLPDNELDNSKDLTHLQDLLDGVDILIHDAQYTRELIVNGKRGWGHSAFEDVAEFAKKIGCGELLLFHHDPDATDTVLDKRQSIARKIFPNTTTAFEGLQLPLDPSAKT